MMGNIGGKIGDFADDAQERYFGGDFSQHLGARPAEGHHRRIVTGDYQIVVAPDRNETRPRILKTRGHPNVISAEIGRPVETAGSENDPFMHAAKLAQAANLGNADVCRLASAGNPTLTKWRHFGWDELGLLWCCGRRAEVFVVAVRRFC